MWTKICLTIIIKLLYETSAHSEVHEYCQWESFNAACAFNEVIMMTSALYGRMKVGRCLPVDYYVGCSADVLDHVELRCSGRQNCSISIPDPDLFRVQPCRKDLVAYFEASYTCVPVSGLDDTTDPPEDKPSTPLVCDSRTELTDRSGYLTSISARQYGGLGSTKCPWSIRAPKGQRINITLYDFSPPPPTTPTPAPVDQPDMDEPKDKDKASANGLHYYRQQVLQQQSYDHQNYQKHQRIRHGGLSADDRCPVRVLFKDSEGVDHPQEPGVHSGWSDGVLIEGGKKGEFVAKSCAHKTTKKFMFTSSGNHVQVSLLSASNETYFVLHYQVTGCADLVRPPHAWLTRTTESLIITCNNTSERWHLVCRGEEWIGAYSNCTPKMAHKEEAHSKDPPLPIGLLVAIAIGAVVGIFIGCVCLMVVLAFRKNVGSARTYDDDDDSAQQTNDSSQVYKQHDNLYKMMNFSPTPDLTSPLNTKLEVGGLGVDVLKLRRGSGESGAPIYNGSPLISSDCESCYMKNNEDTVCACVTSNHGACAVTSLNRPWAPQTLRLLYGGGYRGTYRVSGQTLRGPPEVRYTRELQRGGMARRPPEGEICENEESAEQVLGDNKLNHRVGFMEGGGFETRIEGVGSVGGGDDTFLAENNN